MENTNEKLTMRPLKLKEDYDQLIPFYDQIFEKELLSKGSSVQALLSEMKAFMPIFRLMGIFSKNYRHVFDGFVFENEQKEIISTVNVGYSGNYWEIAMVATHPNYRRKGLAKQLIEKSLDHAKQHKAEMCVLEVLEENTPAYQLYVNYGFQHFDTKMKMKCSYDKLPSKEERNFPVEYYIQERKRDKKTSKEMFELEQNSTPEKVLEFLPVNRIKYQKPLLMRIIRPFVKLFVNIQAERWNMFHKDKLVGILFLDFGKSKQDCHNIEAIIDSKHEKKITNAAIEFGLKRIKNKSKLPINTITIVRKSNDYLIKTFIENGFDVFETDHILGLKF